eukprot:6188594-Pleurochrysis_carterae.AAC.1
MAPTTTLLTTALQLRRRWRRQGRGGDCTDDGVGGDTGDGGREEVSSPPSLPAHPPCPSPGRWA